jgi:hypothetical protein
MLLALYGFASKVQEGLKVEKLLSTTVELVPEAGLRVLRNGIEVKQARLGELKNLRVEAAPTPTPLWLYAVVTIIAIIIVAGVVIAMRRKATKVAPPAPPAPSKA